MHLKSILLAFGMTVGMMAIANRISFTRNLIGTSSVQPWF